MNHKVNNVTDNLHVGNKSSANKSSTNKPSTNNDSIPYSETYFDALYDDNSDPWHYQTRWYEKRKRDMCLAVLPQAKYDNAIELGCGNGVFSELLAPRCQALLSIDGNHNAVQLARQRLIDLPHVSVIKEIIPNALTHLQKTLARSKSEPKRKVADPINAHNSPFDLIVISEILYYLSPDDIDRVIAWIAQNLAPNATLLCCHWRYNIDGFEMNGDKVHQRLYQAFDLTKPEVTHQVSFVHQSSVVDSDFLLDVWQNSPDTVAMSENLV